MTIQPYGKNMYFQEVMLFHAVTLESPFIYTLGQRLFNNCSTSDPVGYGMIESQLGAYNQAIFNKLQWSIFNTMVII